MVMKLLHRATLFATIPLSKNQNQNMHTTWDTNKNYLFLYFKYSKNSWENEKVHVTKVVDLVTRIPEQLILHFSDFSTNLYRFYKFAVFENKKKKKTRSCIYAPGKIWVITNRSLAGLGAGETSGCRIPARKLTGGVE